LRPPNKPLIRQGFFFAWRLAAATEIPSSGGEIVGLPPVCGWQTDVNMCGVRLREFGVYALSQAFSAPVLSVQPQADGN